MYVYIRWCFILNKQVREGITEKEPFCKDLKDEMGASHMGIWTKSIPRRIGRRPIREVSMSKSE